MSFLKAMQYGQVIENPGAYKSTQNTINFLVAVMGIGVSVLHSYGFAVNLSEEHVVTIATALAVFYSAFNVVFTMVTSDKSGIKISASQPSPSQVMAEQLPRLIAALEKMLEQPPVAPAVPAATVAPVVASQPAAAQTDQTPAVQP